MLFLVRVVPAVLAAASLVQALSVPRSDGGKDDDFFSGFIDALNEHNLTTLADNYQTDGGKRAVDKLKSGGDITLLAPENCAFDPDHPKIDSNLLLFNALLGNIDDDFQTPHTSFVRRDGVVQSRSIVPSQFGVSSGAISKRANYSTSPRNIDKVIDFTRKRSHDSIILVDGTVGDAKVKYRFTFKKIIILVIDTLLPLPGKASDALCKPLVKDSPDGFSEFSEGLQKTGLLDKLESCDHATVFAPLDELFGDISKLSKDDLSYLIGSHVILGQSWYSPEFVAKPKLTTESGKELHLLFENGVHYVKCGKAKAVVIRSDVHVLGGVIHVIDRPLKCD